LHTQSLPSIELEKLERLIVTGDFLAASNYFHEILLFLLSDGGASLATLLKAPGAPENFSQLLIRLCSAIGQVIVRPEFEASIPNLETLVLYQSILSKIFGLTPFVSTDYIVKELLQADENGIISSSNLLKAFLIFSTESNLTKHFQYIGRQNPDLYAATCLMMIWACTGSEQSCANREWAYGELNILLNEKTPPSLPLGLIHGFFMHSSYGFSRQKHELKRSINQIIQKSLPTYPNDSSRLKLSSEKLTQDNEQSQIIHFQKPVLLVILEYFHPQHSVYRALGASLQACKEYFTLVAVAWPDHVLQLPNDFFDIQITLSGTKPNYCLDELFGIVSQYQPVAVYYPSIGMSPWTIYYSNVRLAPVQFTTIGHAASTFAAEIDYFLVEEDISGDPDTYSEKLICLPIGSMPFYPPISIEYYPRLLSHSDTLEQKIIHIGCCSTLIKLNSHLLLLCQRLDRKYQSLPNGKKVTFTFFLQIRYEGITVEFLRQLILRYLPNATIYVDLPFQVYLDKLALMDIAISPFPYGGMNGIIDCATLGVVGVCMQGPQIHEAMNCGMMRRMDMPEWLIANDEEQYEIAVSRLIDNDEERFGIKNDLIMNKKYLNFFNGNSAVFANHVKKIVLG